MVTTFKVGTLHAHFATYLHTYGELRNMHAHVSPYTMTIHKRKTPHTQLAPAMNTKGPAVGDDSNRSAGTSGGMREKPGTGNLSS